ncbi:MAG: DNA repair protein RecO [Myxococcales bacterium]|nr:DNA repair protein RecO [Myxococcales bacterium]
MQTVEGEPALVLRRTEYGESDLIVGLYGRTLGKIVALARGARRSRKRFGAGLGLFTISEIGLQTKPKASMWTLLNAQPVQNFTELASDVAAMAHGSYGTELVRELSVPELPEPALFDLLVDLYKGLADSGPRVGRLRVFELRLLMELGLAPLLTRCAACHESLGATGMHWAPERGGALCDTCSALELSRGMRPISAEAIDYLITAQALTKLESGDALDTLPAAVEARQAMLSLLYWHVGKPLKSVEFIAKLRNKE